MSPVSIAIVTVSAADLQALIETAVEKVLRNQARIMADGNLRLSASEAAVRAKRRRSVVLAACESGELPAFRQGNRWSIAIKDLDCWAGKAQQ